MNVENSFKTPDIIHEIKLMQDSNILNGEEFEFWIDFQNESRYSICPIDAIPFASTGNNGIHFAFLTDFGKNKDLNNAPIICIAPSYDPPINLVANNLKQFLSIVTTIENATLLADRYKSENEFESRRTEWFEGFRSESHIANERKNLANLMKNKFSLNHIDNVMGHLDDIRKSRKSLMDEESMDGLGIRKINNEPILKFEYSKNVDTLKSFLTQANKNSRLMVYRNSYFAYILAEGYDYEIKQILKEFLQKDGYIDEAERLKLY